MARSIASIKQEITDTFIAQQTIKQLYQLKDGKSFNDQFSVVSLESIFFYIIAVSIWTLEKLFDLHKQEVNTTLSNKKPHRLKWYRDKALAFQKDYTLPVDSDVYDNLDEKVQIVKYAAAVEPTDSSRLQIKIAGGDKLRDRLSDSEATQVYNYLQHIKDAGVRIDLINQAPDYFSCQIDIYYDAMLLPSDVEQSVRDAINNHIENLDFNGEFSNMGLTDVLQRVEGVVIPELKESKSHSALLGFEPKKIEAKRIPEAGYFRVYNDADVTLKMIPYELVQD